MDPFAGGGSIPLEALRVGADAFASDLNPVAVLLNKVVLEYIPKYGQRLADEVRKWGEWIKGEAEKELAEFYPKDPDGATPIAYLWARTIQCEGPGCGAEVPLMRSLWLAKKGNRSVALQLVPRPKAKRVDFRIIVKQPDGWVDQDDPRTKIEDPKFDGTVKRGSATCPCCGYTTPVERVRGQLRSKHGGAQDARLFCVVTTRVNEQGSCFRLPIRLDLEAVQKASDSLNRKGSKHESPTSLWPNEEISLNEIRRISLPIYGMTSWGDLFSARQLLVLVSLHEIAAAAPLRIGAGDLLFEESVRTCISLAINTCADHNSTVCSWRVYTLDTSHVFGRQAIPMAWDYAETCSAGESTGSFLVAIDKMARVLESLASLTGYGCIVAAASAGAHPLPSDSAHALITDPPYYDAVPYAHLSDFFYVWLRRSVADIHPDLFVEKLTPKQAEVVVDRPHELSTSNHDVEFYERELTNAFGEGRRILRPEGIGLVVFASKTTASWEAILNGVVEAGWIVTGSWPVDTEMPTKLAGLGQARLMSSVHLVCRPRENLDGSVRTDDIGDWRDVLDELPRRIHDWMPRLAAEGVVGADAIFACLGPALEIFSRYSRVEKSDGSVVPLREFLEHVWAAVSKEALSMIFKDADASGLEPDARLTAMWLWTVRPDPSGTNSNGSPEEEADEDQEAEDEDPQDRPIAGGGYAIEFDAARKIAQGLGANLDALKSVVEVKGKTARLLLVSEREPFLFARPRSPQSVSRPSQPTNILETTRRGKSKRPAKGQRAFGVNEEEGLSSQPAMQREARADVSPHDAASPDCKTAETVLDRIHQSMLLFARGRSDALKRFLVDDGIGKDARFWKLAQSLSALYPPGTDEKRWVDGVLARKKGLGL